MTAAHSPAATAGLVYVLACRLLRHVTSIHIPSATCFTVCLSFLLPDIQKSNGLSSSRENFTHFCDVPQTINNERVSINSDTFPLFSLSLNSTRNQEISHIYEKYTFQRCKQPTRSNNFFVY